MHILVYVTNFSWNSLRFHFMLFRCTNEDRRLGVPFADAMSLAASALSSTANVEELLPAKAGEVAENELSVIFMASFQ